MGLLKQYKAISCHLHECKENLTARAPVTVLMLASCRSIEPSHTPPPDELVLVSPTQLAGPCGDPRGTLAFASYRDGESEIYSMNSDGSDLTRITEVEDRVSKPAWSPDGTSIAYIATVGNQYVEIFTMSADGSNQTRLTENWSVDTEPAWAPTSGNIAFSTSRDSYLDIEDGMTYGLIYDFEIYVMDAYGACQVRLTNDHKFDGFPDWRP